MHISLSAEHIFTIFGFSVTNTLLMSWIAIGILIIISITINRKLKLIPDGFQNFIESIIEVILNFIEKVVGEKKQAEQFFPLIATIFIFILLSNWLGLIPGIGSIGFFEIDQAEHGVKIFIPLLRSTNSDINMTLALAIISVMAAQIFGIAAIGTFKYISKYINFKNPLLTFTGILEFIAEIAKLISFSFRLFGNVFAGEVLLVVIAFLVPFIAPLPFMLLELFVGLIQSLIFAMLTLVFLKIAVSETH